MADIERFSKQVIDYAERLVDVADAAKGKGPRHAGGGARWMLLPAAGAGLYALATSTSFTRRTKDVMEQAKSRASDLPEDLLNRVRQSSSGPARSASSNGTQKRSAGSNRGRRTSNSRRKSSASSRSRSSSR
jgi:hypothetical protein